MVENTNTNTQNVAELTMDDLRAMLEAAKAENAQLKAENKAKAPGLSIKSSGEKGTVSVYGLGHALPRAVAAVPGVHRSAGRQPDRQVRRSEQGEAGVEARGLIEYG